MNGSAPAVPAGAPVPRLEASVFARRRFRLARHSPWIVAAALIAAGCEPAEDHAGDDDDAVQVAGLELENLERVVRTMHGKFTSLAEAMPADDLDWRPMEGVRSVEEVFIHVAADNWYVPALMGWDAPAETGVTSDNQTFRDYQSRTMTRDEMLAALDASFLETMEASTAELDREVVLGTPTTVGDVWIRAVVHLHEHLGQSIAYARSNGVVPPWSG